VSRHDRSTNDAQHVRSSAAEDPGATDACDPLLIRG
jgi:hypothetical protein